MTIPTDALASAKLIGEAGKVNGASFGKGEAMLEAAKAAMLVTLTEIGDDKAMLAVYSAAWRKAYTTYAKCTANAASAMFKNKKSQALTGRKTLRPPVKPAAKPLAGSKTPSTLGKGGAVSGPIIEASLAAASLPIVGVPQNSQLMHWAQDVCEALRTLSPHINILSKEAQSAFAKAQSGNGVILGLLAKGAGA